MVSMDVRSLISFALCLYVVLGATGVAGNPSTKISAPLFAWSDQQYFSVAGRASQASYQAYDDFFTTIKQLVTSAFQNDSDGFMASWLDKVAVQQQTPEVVLIMLGTQLKTSDLQGKTAEGTLAPLHSMLSKAVSSLTVPYVMHEAGSAVAQEQKLLKALADTSKKTIVVGCAAADQQDAEAAVQELGDGPGLIIVCTKVPAESAGTPEGVAAELQQVQHAHNAVAAHSKRQLTVYALRPDASTVVHRRRLQASNADVGVCGQLCQTQVKWLEGILATFILAIAAFSGMCCLYMLDTPTRFDKPKEGARTD